MKFQKNKQVNKLILSLFISLFLINSNQIIAQDIELTAFSGFTFKHSFGIQGGSAGINDGVTNGGILTIGVREEIDLEILYSRQETSVFANSYRLDENIREDATTSYLLIGANRTGEISSNFEYFGGLKFGVGVLAIDDDEIDDVVKFSILFGGGLKYFITDRIGLRVGANLYMPVVSAGASLWFGSGGASAGVSTYSPIVQFNLQGGLTYRFP